MSPHDAEGPAEIARLALFGFADGPPTEIVGACAALGLDPAFGPDLSVAGRTLALYDARAAFADDLLDELGRREGVALAYGPAPENDPIFDSAFDDVLAPGSGEAALRRRLLLALRLSSELRRGEIEGEDRADALRMANSSLEFALRRFEALFQGLPAACFTMDSTGMVHEWNREATEVLGLQAYATIYQTAQDVLGPQWAIEEVERRLKAPGETTFDWKWKRPDGKTIHLACRLLAMTSESGERSVIIATNLDVTSRAAAQRKADLWARRAERQSKRLAAANEVLNAIALTDPLTGLGNRRRFDEMLDAARERSLREGRDFALLLLDIDHFKSVNDVFGHAAGDDVLREMAHVLKRCARKLEAPARLGGEEFALLLENCDAEKATLVATRIRTTMSAWSWPHRPITASIGIAVAHPDEILASLYNRADAALYQAKHGGRDQACLAA